MKEVIVTGGFGGSGGLGGSCSFWNILRVIIYEFMKKGQIVENLEKDLVEEVDNGCCEAKVQPGGGELSPSPLHLLDLLRCI